MRAYVTSSHHQSAHGSDPVFVHKTTSVAFFFLNSVTFFLFSNVNRKIHRKCLRETMIPSSKAKDQRSRRRNNKPPRQLIDVIDPVDNQNTL